MEYVLKNGIVFDPKNNVNGEQMDIFIKDEKIVDKVSSDAKIIDVRNKLVMPGGVDLHSHIAGPKLTVGRIYRPEDIRKESNLHQKMIWSILKQVFHYLPVQQLVTDIQKWDIQQ